MLIRKKPIDDNIRKYWLLIYQDVQKYITGRTVMSKYWQWDRHGLVISHIFGKISMKDITVYSLALNLILNVL